MLAKIENEIPLVVVYEKGAGSGLTEKILVRAGLSETRVNSLGELFGILHTSCDLLIVEGFTAMESFSLLKRIEQFVLLQKKIPKVISVILIGGESASLRPPLLVGVNVLAVLKDKQQLKQVLNSYRMHLRKNLFQNPFRSNKPSHVLR